MLPFWKRTSKQIAMQIRAKFSFLQYISLNLWTPRLCKHLLPISSDFYHC